MKSIDRIAKPSAQILEAKQKILFQLGTQSFANADFEQALKYLNQSIAIGQYNRQTKADAYYWCGESYYRLSRMVEAARDFNAYLQLTTQPNNEMYALANYNLGLSTDEADADEDNALVADYAQGESPVKLLHVPLFGAYIHYGRKSAAVTCRETAFIEIHVFDNIRIESGKQPAQMVDLVKRCSVQQKKVLIVLAPVYIHTGK